MVVQSVLLQTILEMKSQIRLFAYILKAQLVMQTFYIKVNKPFEPLK